MTELKGVKRVNIEIIPAKITEKKILANLLELYAYEFTAFWDFDLGDDGFYGYEHLDQYWTDPNRFPFLVYVDGKIAGFVFVQKGSPISEEPDVFDISEFFILQKYKQKKIGSFVAVKIWEMFKGAWQVRVLIENTIASAFWSKTIQHFTHGQAKSNEKLIKNDRWLVYRFTA